ncbi:MAG: hypothetical protein EHM80_15955 [Nitrospiraceae bacterium]|nr:MAG: hypothetical protein EHM80_15955 [Nitrospiraceae bacterium]
MSKQIAEALAAAKPDERVTFYLSQPQTSVKRVITTGGLYIHGTELHFILGNWQVLYGIPTYGMIYDRRYPMRPTAAKGFYLYFYPAEATVIQQHSLWDTLLANATDELVIDLTKIDSGPPHLSLGAETSPCDILAVRRDASFVFEFVGFARDRVTTAAFSRMLQAWASAGLESVSST